jgi:AcrR family transcriptional regulator
MSNEKLGLVKRKKMILAAAIFLSENQGYQNIKRDDIATTSNCANGSINATFGTIEKLKRAVMIEAIKSKNLNIIAQGLVHGDLKALAAPDELKRAALENILGV